MTSRAKELVGDYTLVEFNGKAFPPSRAVATLKLKESGDKLEAYIKVLNTMHGMLSYENGKLTGSPMSTMMMGSGLQMDIEGALSVGLAHGMDVSRQLEELVLTSKDCALRFLLASGVAKPV